MTGMYNVVEVLRRGEPLTDKDREIHEIAACGVLRDLHDELDRLVAEAYGWPWPMEREEILDRLVALHDERVEEESRGIIRWLRPEYQRLRFDRDNEVMEAKPAKPAQSPTVPTSEREPWPSGVIDQLTALQSLLGTGTITAAEAAARFDDAPVATIERQLELLADSGEVWRDDDGRYWKAERPA